MEYVNENLGPGHWGYFAIILSFCGALLSAFAYYQGLRTGLKTWRNIGRLSFMMHGIGVASIFGILYHLISTHQFQYNYVWAHSSLSLPRHYIISCFWEGQEGSFLLWTFWHFVLGLILIKISKGWEAPVMVVLALAQVMLASMLLGIEKVSLFGAEAVLPFKLGSNPFILLRQAFPDLPVFRNADYTSLIADGRGLNALLQNYWMVIHPPVLFLGFATTIIPFAYAMAGMWTGRIKEWVKPAIPWSLVNGGILGLGILMGGAWAYEALSFGGFWAWDPVENASLVPWMLAVSGLHAANIFVHRGTTLRMTVIFISLAFLLILYSTFLTRSGILGDSSVHSFTDLGLSGQLLIFLLSFVAMVMATLVARWRKLNSGNEEDNLLSREFWMFIGALLISLAALHIISITSLPVINKIFGTKFSAPPDVIAAYHLVQIPFAIVILLLLAVGQYFKWLKTPAKIFWRRTYIALIIALLLSFGLLWLCDLYNIKYALLLVAAVLGMAGNADVLFERIKARRLKTIGTSVGHLGFALIILGALISNAKKSPISLNTEGFQIGQDSADSREQLVNKVLFKNKPAKMANYQLTYKGDSVSGEHIFFNVHYQGLNEDGQLTDEQFSLSPYVIYNAEKDRFDAPSPDTRHYLTKDIFTHITSASNTREAEYQVSYDTTFDLEVKQNSLARIDSLELSIGKLRSLSLSDSRLGGQAFDIAAGIGIEARTPTEKISHGEPVFTVKGGQIIPLPFEDKDLGLRILLTSINPSAETLTLQISRGKPAAPQFITLKAIVFPGINLLWAGAVLMVLGFGIAAYRRFSEGGQLKKTR